MNTFHLGPLVFPWPPVLLLAAFAAARWMALRRVRARDATQVEAADNALWWALAGGLLAARAGHVLRHWEAYGPALSSAPWLLIDIRDGGWWATPGVLVGGLLLWRATRAQPLLKAPLWRGALWGLALWWAAGWWVASPQAPVQPQSWPVVGVQPLDGSPAVNLAERARADGRGLVLNLWASWCGPCRAEMPLLTQAAQQHPDVWVLLANQGESEATVRDYLRREGLPAEAIWRDPASALGPALGSRGLPTTVVFNRRGELVARHVGVLNAASLNLYLEQARR